MPRMMSFRPGHRPPQVTMAAVVLAGLKKIFSRGPAASKLREPTSLPLPRKVIEKDALLVRPEVHLDLRRCGAAARRNGSPRDLIVVSIMDVARHWPSSRREAQGEKVRSVRLAPDWREVAWIFCVNAPSPKVSCQGRIRLSLSERFLNRSRPRDFQPVTFIYGLRTTTTALATNALEPHIDAKTMEIHHDKHHAAYVTNLNKALESAPDLAGKSAEDII